MRPLRIVYDGECPFCSGFVRLARLRESFDVDLVDARQAPELVPHYAGRGLDLNVGMVVEVDDETYHGGDAVWLIAALSSRSGARNKILAALFATRPIARALYPALRLGRRMTLRALRKAPL